MSGRIYDSYYNEEIKCISCGATNVRRPSETNFNGYFCVKCNNFVKVDSLGVPMKRGTQNRIDRHNNKCSGVIIPGKIILNSDATNA